MPLFGRKKNKKDDKAATTNSNKNNNSNKSASAKPQVVVKIVGDSKHVTTTKTDARGNALRETVISKLTPEELRLLSGNDDNGGFSASFNNVSTASVTAANPNTGQALSATARTSNTKATNNNSNNNKPTPRKPGKSLEEAMGNGPYTPPPAPYNPHNNTGGRPNPPSDEPSIAAWSLTDDLNRPRAQLGNQQQQHVNDDPSIAGWSLAEGISNNPSAPPARSAPPPPPQQQQAQQQPLRPVREDISSAPSADSATSPNNNSSSNTTGTSDQEAIAVTRELVKQFIADIWNRGDVELIPRVCHRKLRFNGHVGMDLVGHDGFARMVTTVRDALTDYHCEIHSMVVESNKAFCRLRFSGKHTGNLLGYPPTGKSVTWMGASEFTCKDGQILKVWELGDVKSLEEQLRS
eukprot:Nitzschia sp. Nitz4//scaffold106_size73319//3177//4397//NITZ4_005725-RA/size73319-processed-gene-0.33-mRNA-1//1//CDS//3329532487//1781//frame0